MEYTITELKDVLREHRIRRNFSKQDLLDRLRHESVQCSKKNTLPQLRKIAAANDISTTIRKADLLERLEHKKVALSQRPRNVPVRLLKQIARHRKVKGFSRMNKPSLVRNIFTIRQTNTALRGFTEQHTIDGVEKIDALTFLNQIQPIVIEYLQRNPEIKFQLSLSCTMHRTDLSTGITDEAQPVFLSGSVINLQATDREAVYTTCVNKMMESMANFQRGGSNWRFIRVERLEINTAVFRPLRGNSYIPLPQKLAAKKAIINMENIDNQCFKWCVTRALNLVPRDNERITKLLKNQSEDLDWTDIDFPVSLKNIDKFEKNNSGIFINVFGYENAKIYPLRHSRNEDAIDLLLLTDGENSHYCVIKNFNRLMNRGDHHAMHYCKRCLNGFTYEIGLRNHLEYCSQHELQRIEMPKPGTILKFKNYNRSMRVPFVVYADFESFIKPIDTCQPYSYDSYTNKYQKH